MAYNGEYLEGCIVVKNFSNKCSAFTSHQSGYLLIYCRVRIIPDISDKRSSNE